MDMQRLGLAVDNEVPYMATVPTGMIVTQFYANNGRKGEFALTALSQIHVKE